MSGGEAGLIGAATGLAAGYVSFRILSVVTTLQMRSVPADEVDPEAAAPVAQRLRRLKQLALAVSLVVFPVVGFGVGHAIGSD